MLIGFGIVFAVALTYATARLAAFDEAVESIVRIDVAAGVLADLPEVEAVDEHGEPVTMDAAALPRNFLVIGIDSAIGLDPSDPASHRDHPPGFALSDVIMLVRVDPGVRRIHLMSLPRDLYVPIHRDGVPVRSEKLASAMMVGGLEQGAPTLVETVSANFDVPIHNFVVIDFFGFQQLVDLIGGVPMWFEYPLRDLGSALYLDYAGCHVLQGRQALAYVRSRKLEALVDGWWRRVGASNDMERNQRQQDFIISGLRRLVDRGVGSVLASNDLVEAAADAVAFDERLTVGGLLDLARSFAAIEPEHVVRHVLPVVDANVGELSVLELGTDARAAFYVFRGVAQDLEDVPILLVDARGGLADATSEGDLAELGFPVEAVTGQPVEESLVRAAPERFPEAVLVARFVQPTPRFEFVDGFGDVVELTLGTDFIGYVFPPASFDEVEAAARAGLPGPGAVVESGAAVSGSGGSGTTLPMAVTVRTPARAVSGVDGVPPDGVDCG